MLSYPLQRIKAGLGSLSGLRRANRRENDFDIKGSQAIVDAMALRVKIKHHHLFPIDCNWSKWSRNAIF
jgi:hypothetical protein